VTEITGFSCCLVRNATPRVFFLLRKIHRRECVANRRPGAFPALLVAYHDHPPTSIDPATTGAIFERTAQEEKSSDDVSGPEKMAATIFCGRANSFFKANQAKFFKQHSSLLTPDTNLMCGWKCVSKRRRHFCIRFIFYASGCEYSLVVREPLTNNPPVAFCVICDR